MRNIPIPPHALLDFLIKKYELKNSRALSKHLGLTQGALSKIRYGVNKPSADFILTVYDKTDLSIEEIRALISKQEKINGKHT